ncbi:S-transferase class-mu 28 kDa isozyme [Seminavis robusta]|uniref:S-transferase class-mu 28 kDa isozyme n=1 Tax=Seminavis robusta TaxID=568900 RepID=A0A9N8EI05_9STRA|nr:S-transferase class-mu 28 kDa isozyme [Seminavis robusta]|eukprot:Sro1023_g232550.1 S-transferase class-mu 28 kDa isozyme (205) ;mRNA; f:27718-28679
MASPPELEVIYFDAPGRAEPIRIMLHAAGLSFTDTRFPGKDWPTVKPTTPLGFVPVLKVNGNAYCQSKALMRFAAKKAGMYPTDDLEALAADEAMDVLDELMATAPKSKDPAELEKLRKEFEAGGLTNSAKFLEARIQGNGGCYLGGKSCTMADLGLQLTVKGIQAGFWDHISKDFFEAYPGIIATVKAVDEDEKVKAYYASKE